MILDQNSVSFMLEMLDGKPGAGGVLNDYLEEIGHERVVADNFDSLNDSERVSMILNDVLPDRIARLIVTDFAEHVWGQVKLSDDEVKSGKEIINRFREFLNSNEVNEVFAEDELIETAGSLLSSFWQADSSPRSRAAWSVWASIMGKPSNAAVSAQAVNEDELIWQLSHLHEKISKLAD